MIKISSKHIIRILQTVKNFSIQLSVNLSYNFNAHSEVNRKILLLPEDVTDETRPIKNEKVPCVYYTVYRVCNEIISKKMF